MFCPFKQMSPVDGDIDNNFSDLDDEELDQTATLSEPNFEEEVNTLEGLMRQAMMKGGKCPFMFDSKPPTTQAERKPVVPQAACPFSKKPTASNPAKETEKVDEKELVSKWINENVTSNEEFEGRIFLHPITSMHLSRT